MVSVTEYRFYADLAGWWPLISPPGEYAEEAAFFASVLDAAPNPVRDVLELGSGGGHNAVHLKSRFALTLIDLSPEMLAVSRILNPECEHRQGDLRTVRLRREFDAVFVHDAVAYMTDEADLRRAMQTAFVHCRLGGLAVFVPDDTAESFTESSDHGGGDGADGSGARYLAWSWDPDRTDSWILTEYAFLLREAGGSVQVVHETHRTGLFGRDVWLRLLAEVGFDAEAIVERTSEDRPAREVFLGRRPGAAAAHHHAAAPAGLVHDEAFWNERYRSAGELWSGRPNAQLLTEAADLAPGTALDVACGEGADAIWLAERGWQVTAVDLSSVALDRGAARALDVGADVVSRITWVHADLADWVPKAASYDLVSAQYLHVPSGQREAIHRRLVQAVAPGGTLLIVGHHPSDLATTARRPPLPDLLFTAEDVASALPAMEWVIHVQEARPGTAMGTEGRPVTIHDTVLRAQRAAAGGRG